MRCVVHNRKCLHFDAQSACRHQMNVCFPLETFSLYTKLSHLTVKEVKTVPRELSCKLNAKQSVLSCESLMAVFYSHLSFSLQIAHNTGVLIFNY